MEKPLSVAEIKEYERMFDENILSISAFAASHGYRITLEDEQRLCWMIVDTIKYRRENT